MNNVNLLSVISDMSKSDKLREEKLNIKQNDFSKVAAGQQTQQDSFVTQSSSSRWPDDQTVSLCHAVCAAHVSWFVMWLLLIN